MADVGDLVIQPVTGVQDSATTISKGHVCVLNNTASAKKVVRASSDNQAGALWVALEDAPGQNLTFAMARTGDICRVKISGTVTQNDKLMSAANGGAKTTAAVASTVYNLIGVALQSGVDGDLISMQVAVSQWKA